MTDTQKQAVDLDGLTTKLELSLAGERTLFLREIRGLLQATSTLRAQLAEAEARVEALKADLWRHYLDQFTYEDWGEGHDGKMRVGDWVELNWQDHNGSDHFDGIGRVIAHHLFGIPILIQVEGFEDDGEPHGTYVPLSISGYNTLRPITEEDARAALQEED